MGTQKHFIQAQAKETFMSGRALLASKVQRSMRDQLEVCNGQMDICCPQVAKIIALKFLRDTKLSSLFKLMDLLFHLITSMANF